MNPDEDIFELLEAETVDPGCAAGFEVLHQYVESQLNGVDPDGCGLEGADRGGHHELPALATHLRSCPACRDDYSGLVDAAKRFGDARPTPPLDQ